jgi:hypothetical protein
VTGPHADDIDCSDGDSRNHADRFGVIRESSLAGPMPCRAPRRNSRGRRFKDALTRALSTERPSLDASAPAIDLRLGVPNRSGGCRRLLVALGRAIRDNAKKKSEALSVPPRIASLTDHA